MPRTNRLDIPGLLHHVIVRGVERRQIFLDDQDRSFFLGRFSKLLQETQTDCLAWSLLTNHFHVLLRPNSSSLATFMRRLLTSYAVTFNLRHKRSGHLFQNRYKSLLCDEEAYLLELVRYIHLNPIRAGLVNGLEDLDFYPWCGHAAVLGNRSLVGQATDEVLERFGKTLKSGREKYRYFIAEGFGQKAPEPEETKGLRQWFADQLGKKEDLSSDGRILGGEDFSLSVQADDPIQPAIPLPQLLERVSAIFAVPAALLQRRTRIAGIAEARAVFCFLAVREGGHNGAEVARMLGMSRAGVSIAIRRGEIVLRERPGLRGILSG